MADKDGKTEKATSTKRRKATEKGQIAYSQHVASTTSLIASVYLVAWVLSFRGGFRNFFSRLIDMAILKDAPDNLLLDVINETGVYFLLLVAPILAGAWFGALAGNVVQGLPKIVTKAFEPKWERLNPKNGFKKLKTKLSPFEWVRLLTLISVLVVAVWQTLSGYWEELLRTPGVSIEASIELMRFMLVRVLTYILITLAVLAIIDFFVQKRRHEESLKQTKSEVKEDNKQMDGNPQVKGKIRSIQREQAKKRMMAAVQDADVIITNPTHLAVALGYKPGLMAAPRVVAKGQEWLAEKIKEVGREYDIPCVKTSRWPVLCIAAWRWTRRFRCIFSRPSPRCWRTCSRYVSV